MEGLSDRQAATAVRDRIAWKYLLGLELTDPGFDFSVLSEFRARLLTGSAERRVLTRILAVCQEAGLLERGGPVRTDSTHVLAAVRTLNRLELIGETVRAALNALAVAAPRWLAGWMPPDWAERYGHRVENYRLPQKAAERAAYVQKVGADGAVVLAMATSTDTPGWLAQVEAVTVLRKVWQQQFETAADGTLRWREAKELPPSKDRIASPYDVECRYALKRTTAWTGYKGHVTEYCGPDRPHLITDAETTNAARSDQRAVQRIHQRLEKRDLLPDEHLADTNYMSAQVMLAQARDHGVQLTGPVPPDTSRQAMAGEGFDISAFTIDWHAHTATCPQGATAGSWREQQDSRGHDVIRIRFPDRTCAICPVRAKCTRRTSGPRDLVVRPQAEHETLQRARHDQTTEEWKNHYHRRAGIEGTLSQAVRRPGLRRSRYPGLRKTGLQLLLTVAAIDLIRIDAWLTETPLARTRTAPLAALPEAA
ncbi:transposase IS4 family protein [Streptomyces malaysiensis]|uniref:Transposase IS4 family protein n=2 Tax=Streptomyces malaysiensis TaxID=92644 RepID=A0A7X5X9V0_STRMQ|nr:transposase IS4 family protein [Streptomyces malaysiensis]NIY69331.1 transposase IS4 family protein [Streptomyces malaysiensis]